MGNERLKVCLVLEGSYPYITGGVSAWVQDMVLGLREIDFVLLTISPASDQELRYKLPENIVEHVDIVLSQPPSTSTAVKDKDGMLEQISKDHLKMFSGDAPDLTEMIRRIPEGYYLHKDSIKDNRSWDLVVRTNQKRNPVYPFSDYYWAWQSSHDLIFRVLAAKVPEADIYHAISTGFAGLTAYGAKIRHGKPFLLTEHGLYHKEREIEIRKTSFVQGYQRDMWIKTYNKLSEICYKHADRITALFEENRQKQLELGALETKTVVIPNGIDTQKFSGVERVKKPGFHVGLIGRIVPIKDIKTFIATAKIIIDEIPEAIFYAVGPTDEDPLYFDDCAALVKSLRIEDKFLFTGRQNVLEYYSFLDVMLLTSIREAQPLVILEAWSAGVPCVCTKVGNVPEMLDYDERFLAASKDASKLAEGIRYIYNHPQVMGEINERNKNKVLSLYDKKDLLIKFRDLYDSMKGIG